jgi:hypothetical protein
LRIPALSDLDNRTAPARDAMQLRDEIVADLGGDDQLPALKREMATTAAVMCALIRGIEVRHLMGEGIDTTEYTTLVNARQSGSRNARPSARAEGRYARHPAVRGCRCTR